MTPRPHSTIGWVLVVVSLIVTGSMIYWIADGRVGTPDDFRRRVDDAGLEVDWSNSGPRSGTGSVEASCGPLEVEIDEIDDVLWIRWAGNRRAATPDTVDALLSCSPLPAEGASGQR